MTTSPIWTRCRSGLDRCSCSPTIGRPREGVTFWQVSPPVALERWNRMGLGRVYVDGGALISDFLGQGLIDDLVLTKVPCLLYTSPSPRDRTRSRMPSSA